MSNIKYGKALNQLVQGLEDAKADGIQEIKVDDILGLISQLKTESFNQRLSGDEVAEEISNFVNSSVSYTEKEFVDAILTDHRTLQQSVFRLFMKCVEGWADMYDNGFYDARNESTVRFANEIFELKVKTDTHLPLV